MMNIEIEYKLSDVMDIPIRRNIDIGSRRYMSYKDGLSIRDSDDMNIFSVLSASGRYHVNLSNTIFTSNTNGYQLRGSSISKEVIMRDGDNIRSFYISPTEESEIVELINNFNIDINSYIDNYNGYTSPGNVITSYISINAYYLLKNIISVMSKYFTEDIYFRVKEIDEEYLELVHMELKLS